MPLPPKPSSDQHDCKSRCHKSLSVQTIYKTDTPIPLVRHLVPARPVCIPPGSVCLGLPIHSLAALQSFGEDHPGLRQSISTFSGGLSSGVLDTHTPPCVWPPLCPSLLPAFGGRTPVQPAAPSSNGHWQASGIRTLNLRSRRCHCSLIQVGKLRLEATKPRNVGQ